MSNNNTAKSFYDKWDKNPSIGFQQTLDANSEIYKWILNRNGFDNADQFRSYLLHKKNILDAGCGNGRVTALLAEHVSDDAIVTGIDLVAAPIAHENLVKYGSRVNVIAANILDDLQHLGKFDFIYCQEVLHHTGNPVLAFNNLCKLLSDSGEIAIYVYKQKAPVREYVDDYVRDRIAAMSYEEAMNTCKQITALGQVFSDLQTNVTVPAVNILNIEAGTYPVQRFLYHFFLKCFWNNEFTFEENAVINYDWYHPQNCTRHTLEEVKAWFAKAGLKIMHTNVDPYGITIRGAK